MNDVSKNNDMDAYDAVSLHQASEFTFSNYNKIKS